MSPHTSKKVTDSARSKAQGDETGIARSVHTDASRSLFADVETRSEGSMDGVEFTTSVSQVLGNEIDEEFLERLEILTARTGGWSES